jgi:transcription antitermination factor NusG
MKGGNTKKIKTRPPVRASSAVIKNVNDKITILHGPLMQQEGQVMEVNNRMVKVMLPSLGFALVAIDKNNLAKGSTQ